MYTRIQCLYLTPLSRCKFYSNYLGRVCWTNIFLKMKLNGFHLDILKKVKLSHHYQKLLLHLRERNAWEDVFNYFLFVLQNINNILQTFSYRNVIILCKFDLKTFTVLCWNFIWNSSFCVKRLFKWDWESDGLSCVSFLGLVETGFTSEPCLLLVIIGLMHVFWRA